uniref:Lysosomal Pro-X carboxypeptidase n=1 Tax=Araucaria cunninghamii TaxID=56994 RepID=A0A0D6QT28_ARACU
MAIFSTTYTFRFRLLSPFVAFLALLVASNCNDGVRRRSTPTRSALRGLWKNLGLSRNNSSCVQYDVKYFTQNLDHFSFTPESYLKFQQKYLINSKHWGGASTNSPIFVYTGNEGYIEWFTQNTGFMFDIAPKFKALLVFIEHRYYGESMPFGGIDVAYSNSSTQGFLSSTQALADFAILITDLKKNLSAENSPVVVFGGSYGGMLAAWFRLKYPHITIGALASSAPILYFDCITPPESFHNVVSQDFKSESENCFKVIKESWKILHKMASTHRGKTYLRRAFKLCRLGDFDNLEDWLYSAYYEAAETDYPTPANFIQNLPAYPVKHMCKAIDDPSASRNILDRLYGAANIFYNYTGNLSCFDLGGSDPHGEEGWQFQASTEMVMPMDDDPIKSMFIAYNVSYENDEKRCESQYGTKRRPHWITTEYGGHNIKRVLKRFASNIIFFNGLRDPWSSGGVLEDINESVVAIVAEKGAHHVDLRFATKDDPQWLTDVRSREISIIEKWLSEYYSNLPL